MQSIANPGGQAQMLFPSGPGRRLECCSLHDLLVEMDFLRLLSCDSSRALNWRCFP